MFELVITFIYFFISFKYIITAFSLAFGKDIPLLSSWFNIVIYSLGSWYKTVAILFKSEMSFASIPKAILSTIPRLFSNLTAPSAKFSALETL